MEDIKFANVITAHIEGDIINSILDCVPYFLADAISLIYDRGYESLSMLFDMPHQDIPTPPEMKNLMKLFEVELI